MLRSIRRRTRSNGFSLIELMVALVVGLIVVGAVLAFIVAIMKSNRETLQSTRLNQELRATMAVIAADLRRARSVDDPMTSATAGNLFKVIDASTANCILYSYFDGIDDDGDGDVTNDNYHAIRLSNASVVRSSGASASVNCTTVGKTLGSDQVAITTLTFSPAAASSTAREIQVTLSGHLVDQDTSLANITRTITQTVFVRSVGQ